MTKSHELAQIFVLHTYSIALVINLIVIENSIPFARQCHIAIPYLYFVKASKHSILCHLFNTSYIIGKIVPCQIVIE